MRLASEQNVPPNDAGVSAKNIAPQAVAKNDCFRSVRAIFILGEGSSHCRLKRQYLKVARRNASIANVLHARSRLKVDARRASREPRDERRHLVAQELPLFSIQVVAFIARLRPGDAGVD